MKENAVKKIEEIARGLAEGMGFKLKRVYFVKERFGNVLRVVIDKKGGVTVEDCASLSKELNHILDVEDLIEDRYFLEVSSPGVNRQLIEREDFVEAMGKKIKVKLKSPLEGHTILKGKLKWVGEESFALQVDFTSFNINFDNLKEASVEGEE